MDELDWNQQKLADKMGTSQQYISKLCKGQENLTLKNIAQLEEVLGIEIGFNIQAETQKVSYIICETVKINLMLRSNVNLRMHENKFSNNKFKTTQTKEKYKQLVNWNYPNSLCFLHS
jgi:transcriptional regulator with XRE-family HTH domain